jgi:hypothetical protein
MGTNINIKQSKPILDLYSLAPVHCWANRGPVHSIVQSIGWSPQSRPLVGSTVTQPFGLALTSPAVEVDIDTAHRVSPMDQLTVRGKWTSPLFESPGPALHMSSLDQLTV